MIKSLLLSLCLVCSFGYAGLDDLEDINFPLNSSVVVDGFQGLDLLAAVMKKYDNLSLEVVGHTDSIGTASYNQKLSVRRAESVKTYLVSKGVGAAAITTRGDGIDRNYDNATREGRFQNRRVDLVLYETVNGSKQKVSYERLIELFFGKGSQAQIAQAESHDKILMKLTEMEKSLKAMEDKIQEKVNQMERSQQAFEEKIPQMINARLDMGAYSGIGIAAGVDDEGDFTGRVDGIYFKKVSDNFAIQTQGEVSHWEHEDEGQFDMAFILRQNHFQLSAAASYKFVSIEGLDTGRVAQGALMADWFFEKGRFGLFGTMPIADGDVLGEIPLDDRGVFVNEMYISVPETYGISFNVLLTDKIDLSGHAGAIDGETDADITAGLKLDFEVADNWVAYLDAQMNESALSNEDDIMRYMIGVRLGSINKAKHNAHREIAPVEIPRIKYEVLSRLKRKGNTAPVADAGSSRNNVPAGPVTLDGSGSYDPEGDTLSYRWTQTNGPAVELADDQAAVTTFDGVAGETYTFQLTVTDSYGDASADTIQISMEAAPLPEAEVQLFTAVPSTIDRGQFTTLSWQTRYADSVTIEPLGTVGFNGSLVLSPEVTTEYTITATNASGSATQSVTVTVIQPPDREAPVINFFSAAPTTIDQGSFTTLSWSVSDADQVSISNLGLVNNSGSLLISPEETTTYTLTATNTVGEVTAEVTVTVEIIPPNSAPIANAGADVVVYDPQMVTLNGSGSFDPDGDSLVIQWVQISGLPVTLNGGDTLTPSFMAESGEYLFRLVVTDPSGESSSDDVAVKVVSFKN